MRQLLTESMVVALLGGVAGALVGQWALMVSGSLLRSVTTTPNFGYRMDCSFDWKVFAYTLLAVVLTGIFVGLWPALRASRTDVIGRLHGSVQPSSSGAGHHRFRGTLVVVQVAGSVALLVVAGLLVRSLGRAEQMDMGFDPDHMLIMLLDPQQIGYDQTRADGFYRDLEQSVRQIPGVQSVSLASALPLEVPGKASSVYPKDRPLARGYKPQGISYNSVGETYFESMRIPLVRGRAFLESDDTTGRRVAIVNETMAKKLWPSADPIGKIFSLKDTGGPFIEVVGIAKDGQYMFVSPEHQPYFYLPLAQDPSSFRSLLVRSSVPPDSLIPSVQERIRRIAPDLPLIDVRTMEQVVQGLGGLFVVRLAASLAGVVGILGLVLAVTGVYGVVSFSVGRRTREIGIRRAMGAEGNDVLKLVCRQALKLVIVGVGTGLFAAWALTRAMSKLLIGVSTTDPLTFMSVAGLLAGIALFACYVPARRATKVDPMVALRYE
jgi:predicted permease